MRVQTGRDVGNAWSVAVVVFFSTVIVVKLMGRNPERVMPALWTGYVGLAAVGGALLLTGAWVHRHGPSSGVVRAGLYAVITVAVVFWLLAMVFPFL